MAGDLYLGYWYQSVKMREWFVRMIRTSRDGAFPERRSAPIAAQASSSATHCVTAPAIPWAFND